MLDREFVWHACIGGEHVERGKVGVWLTPLRKRSSDNPQAYISAAFRDELAKLSIEWSTVRKRLPPTNPVEQASHLDKSVCNYLR